MKNVDARGLACPQPLLLTKKAIEDDNIHELTILVDNKAAVENVSRFSTNAGFEVVEVKDKEDHTAIRILRKNTNANFIANFDPEEAHCQVPEEFNGKTIFFKSQYLGTGNNDLGALLMKAFIFSLTKVDNKPKRLIFMNSSVNLCIEGAITAENLQHLEANGTEILVCGTCLDFYKLTDKLVVGQISNMYDIAEALTSKGHVIVI
jgi:selenium metabolism protein YedF